MYKLNLLNTQKEEVTKHTFLPGMTQEVIVWQVDSPHQDRDIQGKQCGKVGTWKRTPKTLQLQKRIPKPCKNVSYDIAASTFPRHHTAKIQLSRTLIIKIAHRLGVVKIT